MFKIYLYPMGSMEDRFIKIGFGFGNPNKEDFEFYKKSYEGKVNVDLEDVEDILCNIYETFNINHPSDYKARSLSVGDIIELDNVKYAVASFGFDKLDF